MKDSFNFVDKSLEMPQTLPEKFIDLYKKKYGYLSKDELSTLESPQKVMKDKLKKKTSKAYIKLQNESLFQSNEKRSNKNSKSKMNR